jgi:hypothetical protein
MDAEPGDLMHGEKIPLLKKNTGISLFLKSQPKSAVLFVSLLRLITHWTCTGHTQDGTGGVGSGVMGLG